MSMHFAGENKLSINMWLQSHNLINLKQICGNQIQVQGKWQNPPKLLATMCNWVKSYLCKRWPNNLAHIGETFPKAIFIVYIISYYNNYYLPGTGNRMSSGRVQLSCVSTHGQNTAGEKYWVVSSPREQLLTAVPHLIELKRGDR